MTTLPVQVVRPQEERAVDEVLDVAVHLVGERCGLLVLRRTASQIVARSNQALLRLLV